MSVKISSKYQVVIPRSVRIALQLKPGTAVDVIAKGNIAYLVPLISIEEIQKMVKGRLGGKSIRDKKECIY